MVKKIIMFMYVFAFLFICLLFFILARGDLDLYIEAMRDRVKQRIIEAFTEKEPMVFTNIPTPLLPPSLKPKPRKSLNQLPPKTTKKIIKSCVPPKRDIESIQIENVLYNTISKMDLKGCRKCTKEEKKTIIQLKMFKALQDRNTKLYQKYSKELDAYVN